MANSEGTDNNAENNNDHIFEKYKSLIRPCSVYRKEYKDCKSIRGRFNQYFIFGESLSCDQWRDDNNNCMKWEWMENKESAIELIRSELERKAARMKSHYDNDTWTKRDEPPKDWSKPLPEFMNERNKNSYLDIKLGELAEEEEREKQELIKLANAPSIKEPENKNQFCTFM